MSGACYHHVQVRTGDRNRLVELLRTDPALSRFEYYVGPGIGPWIGVYPRLILRGPKVAQGASKHLKTHAFAFRTFGEGVLLYEYYRNGERHDRYSSSPDAVRRLSDMDPELAEIVRQWEEGMLSADEYRERVDRYLALYDEKVEAVKGRAENALRLVLPSDAARVVFEVVHEVFRGAKADQIVLEVLDRRFGHPRDRHAAREAFEALRREESYGGEPDVYRELLPDPNGVHAVRSVLHSVRQDGVSILRELAAKLGMGGVDLSFQQIDESNKAFEKISPEDT